MKRKTILFTLGAAALLTVGLYAALRFAPMAQDRPLLTTLTLQDENGLRSFVSEEAAHDPERCFFTGELFYFTSQRSPFSGMAQGASWQEFVHSPLSASCLPAVEQALTAPLSPAEEPPTPDPPGVWLRAVFKLPASLLQNSAQQTQIVVLFRPQTSPADLWMFWALAPVSHGDFSTAKLTEWGLEQLKGYGDWFEQEANLFFSYNLL